MNTDFQRAILLFIFVPSIVGMLASCSQAEPTLTPPVTLDIDCSEKPDGYKAHKNTELGIAFCYPGDWILEDFVAESGFISVTPTGFWQNDFPDALVLMYPHETMSGHIEPGATAEDALSLANLFYSGIIEDSEAEGDVIVETVNGLEVATLNARGSSEGKHVFGIMKGFRKDQANAMAITYLFDEDSYRFPAEVIMESIIIDHPQLAETGDLVSIELDEFAEGIWHKSQPAQHVIHAEADSPILLVAQAVAGENLTDPIRLDIYDPQGKQIDHFETGWTGDEWLSLDESIHHYKFGYLPADAKLLIPDQDGEYRITVGDIQGYDEMGEYRLGALDKQSNGAMVIDTVTGGLAENEKYEHTIDGLADQPLMAYVRPFGSNADTFTLSLELLSESGARIEEKHNHSYSGEPVFLQWVPREDSSYTVRVSEVEGQPASFELTTLAEKSAGRTILLASVPYYVDAFDVTIDVQENGDLLVEEQIEFAFIDKDIDQLEIPLPSATNLDTSSIEVWEGSKAYKQSHSKLNGTYEVVEEGGRLILQWHIESDLAINRTFRLRYHARNGIQEDSIQSVVDGELKDSDILDWQVIPADRRFIINNAQVKVTMPYEIELHNVFARGAECTATAETDSAWWGITREVTFTLDRDLLSEIGMEIIIAFSGK